MPYSPAMPRPAESLAEILFHYVHGALLSIGIAVTLLFAGTLLAGELPSALRSLADNFATLTRSTPMTASENLLEQGDGKLGPAMKSIADSIAKRYRIANQASEDIVQIAILAARSKNIDPLLVLAVIGIESRFNPYAESPLGAQGLMQIIGKYHTDKFENAADAYALLDPNTNIPVGVSILREYLRRTGNMDAALKLYGGESDENKGNYAEKVYAEKARLEQVLSKTPPMADRRPTNANS